MRDRCCEYRGVYLEFGPLESAVCARLDVARQGRLDDGVFAPPTATVEELAAVAGVTGRTWQRWKIAGRIPWDAGDTAAVSAGIHPLNLWPRFHEIVEAVA